MGRVPKFSLISSFRFRSILLQTLAILLLLAAAVTGTIWLIFSNLAAAQHRESARSSHHLALSQAGTALDTALEQMGGYLNRIFADQNVTGLIISPARYDYARLVGVMDAVVALENEDELVRQAYLYVFSNDMVYASDGVIGSILDCPDKKELIACLTAHDRISTLQAGKVVTGLLERDGRLFAFQKFPGSRALALLAVELDSELLYRRSVEVDGEYSGYMVYIYDQGGRPLFGRQLPYPDAPHPALTGAGSGVYPQGGTTTYLYTSARSGLRFVTVADNREIIPSFRSTVHAALPYLLVLLALLGVLSVYLIWAVYKPIQDMVYAMASAGHRQDKGNEFDFIRSTLQTNEDKNTVLSGMLADVAPAVTGKLLQALIEDTAPSDDSLRAVLGEIGGPFTVDGRYLVVLLQLEGGESGAGGLEEELALLRLTGLSTQYWEGRTPCQFLQLPGGVCAGVLLFGEDASRARIQFALNDYREMVRKQMDSPREIWRMGSGKLHIGVREIRASYLEAREDLNLRLYYQREMPQPDGEPDSDLALSASFYTERMQPLLQLALDGKSQEAAAGLSLLRDIAESGAGADHIRTIYHGIYNTVIEEMVRFHIDTAGHSYHEAVPSSDAGDPAAMAEEMQRFCRDAITQLESAGRRGRNRHVDVAKKYIEDNYTASALSLDDVSRHVGISSPYLSRIFAETLGYGFLDYLNQYRIEKARQLLIATDLLVADIGYQVGFHSAQNFTRVFKKLMGCTPRQYREEVK